MLLSLTLATIFFLCLQNMESFPTVHKRRYTLLTARKTNWNDINRHCKDNHNGHIFTVHDETVVKVINKYKSSNPWQSSWGDDIWIGMYMTDRSQKDYTWLGECSSSSPTFFDWECGNSCNPTLDSEKLCAKAKKDELVWDFEKCSIDFNGICEEITGDCDFEEHASPGCIDHNSNTVFSSVVSKENCQALCRTKVNAGQECWAATYDQSTQECTLSYHSDPFKFDSNKGPFQSCTSALKDVSWKRCFEPAATDSTSIGSHSYSDDLQPQMKCTNTPTPSTTTTPPTTTTLVETTTTSTILPPTTTVAESSTTTLAETTTELLTTTTVSDNPTLTPTTKTTRTESSSPTTSVETTAQQSTIAETITTTPSTSQTLPETTTTANTTTTGENPTTATTTRTSADSSNPSLTTAVAELSTSTVMLQTSAKDNSTWQTTEANLSCSCLCYDNLNIAFIQAAIDELKKELLVNKKGTSLYRRSLTSAADDRPSAVGIGMTLGVAVLLFVTFSLIIGDVVKVIRCIDKAIKKKQTELSDI